MQTFVVLIDSCQGISGLFSSNLIAGYSHEEKTPEFGNPVQ